MAYKDKDRQREANRQASQRRRDKAKGMTQSMTNEGMTVSRSDARVIPKQSVTVIDERPNEPSDIKAQSYNPMMVGYVPPQD